jgi:hypothetical protein
MSLTEPTGVSRDDIASSTKLVARLLENGECQNLKKYLTPLIGLNVASSWDIERVFVAKYTAYQFVSGQTKGRSLNVADTIKVEWWPRSIEVPPPTHINPPSWMRQAVRVSCWQVFVPLVEQNGQTADAQGLSFVWVKTQDGIKLADVMAVGFSAP